MCGEPSESRKRFNFPERVRQAFQFVKGFDLDERRASDTLVTFANERVFLNVYHGRSSYELGIEIGEQGKERGHSISALIRQADPGRANAFRNPVASDPEQLEVGLSQLSKLVREYGDDALRGDADVFEQLRVQQQEWAEEYSGQVLYNQVAPRAADAFRDGNYALAAELYQSVEPHLTGAERAKLDYSKKRM